MRLIKLGAAMRMCAAIMLSCAVIASASAQVLPPPPFPEAADIAACLCLQRAVDAAGTTMGDSQRAYDASRQEVAGLDTQLQSARASLNVDDSAAVARFRQLLERRDAVFRQSSGPLFAQYSNAVARFNERSGEFNARCANRPTNPVLLSQVQATLVCPPGR
jgi:hypothetical protein